jgi:hypothetical protein
MTVAGSVRLDAAFTNSAPGCAVVVAGLQTRSFFHAGYSVF